MTHVANCVVMPSLFVRAGLGELSAAFQNSWELYDARKWKNLPHELCSQGVNSSRSDTQTDKSSYLLIQLQDLFGREVDTHHEGSDGCAG